MKKKKVFDPVQAEIDQEFPPEYTEPKYEVADVFRKYGQAYRATHNIGGQRLAAMDAIEKCRTTALGGHINGCRECGYIDDISYNSCRNPSCPKCRGSQRMNWVEKRELELLPIQYFHIVSTLPQELVPLARYNPEILYDLLLRTTADTLQGFAQKQWDGKLGIIMALHTWGQTMNDHPHAHCIVTGGALKNDKSAFVRAPKNFLFPVKALSPVFREKFLDALDLLYQKGKLELSGQPELNDPINWRRFQDALREHKWVVYAKHPIDKPEHLIRYLGRYINRIAIANHRIKDIDNGIITFTYKDYRDQEDAEHTQEKTMQLPADVFIDRFLSHVLPRGFRRVRYYGFLVNSLRNAMLILIRILLGLADPEKPYIPDLEAYLDAQGEKAARESCPNCGSAEFGPIFTLLSFHDPPQCLLQGATT